MELELKAPKQAPKEKSDYKEFHYDFPIYDAVRSKLLGLEYRGEDWKGKLGVENVYNSIEEPAMKPEDMKLYGSLSKRLGDLSMYGDAAWLPGLDPTGRAGVKYNLDGTEVKAQISNYDDDREDFMDRAAMELALKKEILDGLEVQAQANFDKDGYKGSYVGAQYHAGF